MGFIPTRSMAGAEGLVAMGLATALVFVGALLGYLPLLSKFGRTGPEGQANAFMIGLGIRLFFTLAGVLVLGMGLVPARTAFLVWAGIGYAVVLVVEIVGLVRGLSTSPSASSATSGSAAPPRSAMPGNGGPQKGSATA